MTKDEIIEMAKQAEITPTLVMPQGEYFKRIERFAALVAEKERKEITAVLLKVGALEDGLFIEKIQERGQKEYRGARLVLTKDGVIQDGWMGDK